MKADTSLRTAFAVAAITATVLTSRSAARPNSAAAAQPPDVPRPYFQPVDRWLGESRAVAVDGHLAYFSVGRSIAVADMEDPTLPRLLGRSAPLPLADGDEDAPPITAIALGNGVLWAITGRAVDGVALFDVTRADEPRFRSQTALDPDSLPLSIAARGTQVVVALYRTRTNESGLAVLQSDSAGPAVAVAEWRDGDQAKFAAPVLWTDIGILAGTSRRLLRLELARDEAGRPALRVIRTTGDNTFFAMTHIVADGCRVVVLEMRRSTKHVTPFDACRAFIRQVGDPRSIDPPLGDDPMSGVALATVMGTRRLLFGSDYGGVWSIDWAALETPGPLTAVRLLPATTNTTLCRGSVAASADRLAVAGCGLETAATDRPEPPSASRGRILGLPGMAAPTEHYRQGLAAAAFGNRVFVVGANIFSEVVRSPDAPPMVGGQLRLEPETDMWPTHWADIAASRDTAWLSNHDSDAIVGVDVRDAFHPVQIARLAIHRDAAVAADDHTLVIAPYENRVRDGKAHVFRLEQPAAPRQVGTISLPIQVPMNGSLFPGEMIVDGAELIVGSSEGLAVIDIADIADPANPRTILMDRTESIRDLALLPDRIVALRSNNLVLYDRTAARAGRTVLHTTVPIPFEADGSAPYDEVHVTHVADRVYAVLSGNRKAQSIDITAAGAPIVGPPFRFPTSIDHAAVSGSLFYGIGHRNGPEVTAFDLGSLLRVTHVLRLPFLANLGD
ncbi:MAG: hypothetical protein IT332_12915 [Ardenticatenales bacterium]|nr:hypothetical protein [Ardenticatenales bacterium]